MRHRTESTATEEPPDELVARSVAMILPQTRASTLITLLLGALYALLFVPHVGWGAYLGWYGAVAAAFIGRQLYFERLLRRHGATRHSLFLIAVVSAVAGWIGSSAIALFAPALPIADLGVATILAVGTVTLAVSILAVQPKVYLAYVVACFLNVFIGWAPHAAPRDAAIIGVGLVLGGSLLVRLAWVLFGQLRDTVEMARQKADLVRQLEQALANEQEARKARSRFLGAASHDLRQPVQALLFLIDLFRNPALRERQPVLAGQIVRTAESIDAMFRHLVDYAQIDAGTLKAQLQPLNLDPVVQAAASGFDERCRSKGLEFALAGARDCRVLADPVLLERLVRNLLDNALKYSRAGRIRLEIAATAEGVTVEVADQGVGMDAADLSQAFNAFWRGRSATIAESDGIGLGLAICKHMAAEMGARLQLHSEPGVGTCAAITLPLAAQPHAPATDAPTAPALQGKRIVVLEDDRNARDALCLWLESAGAQVLPAASEAQLAPLLPAGDPAPDFVLADYRLADGDGATAIAALRRRFGPVPAVILSGERSLQGIATDVPLLQKPVRPEQLLAHMGAGPSAQNEEGPRHARPGEHA